MAVYTEVSDDALAAFVSQYDIGEVVACKGIADGVENSNYLLQTDRGTYILTLYEKRVRREDIPFFLDLMEHLAAQGTACPVPIHGRDGASLRTLCGRPAAIVSFLRGMWPMRILPDHCRQLGTALARMHLAGQSFDRSRANDLSVAAWREIFAKCADGADSVLPGLGAEIEAELDHLERNWPVGIPTGIIHADLFPDNVFFLNHRLSGLIDFYFACTDFFAYDIAVCLNAWCFEPDRSFNVTKARVMLDAYRAERAFSSAEIDALPLLARGSATRFLLTRLHDWLHHPEGALVRRKDPQEYWQKLRFHRKVAGPSAYGL